MRFKGPQYTYTGRKADPSPCLMVAGSIESPICAVIGERQAFMSGNCISRGDYANYCKDKSIREIIEDELDTVISRLMTPGDEAADGRDPGRGESLAWVLAVIEEPYAPNMDKVKNAAMLRYEAKLREATETPVLCSADTDGDPAGGCEEEHTGDDGLCDRHRMLAKEMDELDNPPNPPWHDMRTPSEAAAQSDDATAVEA